MAGNLQLLAFLAVAVALAAGASQRFYSQSSSSVTLSKTCNNYNYKCSRPQTAYRSLYMSNQLYRAFSVCSDGHILLLPSTRSRYMRYSRPSSLRYRRINAIVAGFWANNKYKCTRVAYRHYYTSRYSRRRRYRRRYNRRYRIRYRWSCPNSVVRYGQSCQRSLLYQVSRLVNDAQFVPSSVIWATYSNMMPLSGSQKNNFQILLATRGRVTYAIFIYRSMGWQKSCRSCTGPFMGYSTGTGRGYQYSLPRSAARHLSHSIKIFRISDYQYSTTTATAQYNEETLARLQDALNEAGEVEVQDDDDDNDIVTTTDDDDDDDEIAMTTDDDDDVAMTTDDDDDSDDDALTSEDDDYMANALNDVMQAALEEEEDDGKDDIKSSSSQNDLKGDTTSKKKSQSGAAKKENGK